MNKKTKKIYLKIKELTSQIENEMFKLTDTERLEAITFVSQYLAGIDENARKSAYRKILYLKENN